MSPTVNASGDGGTGGTASSDGGGDGAVAGGDGVLVGCGDGGAAGGACGSGAGCACTEAPMGWMASATKQIKSIRTRGRPHAVSIGSACGTAPHARRKLEVDHDFPLVQMSGNVVIEGEAHQHDQQGNPNLLTEALGALR